MAKQRGIANIISGKIIGVDPGTRAYFHEEGHLEYQNTEEGIRNIYRRELLKDWIIPGMLVALLWLPAIFIPGICYLIIKFLEIKEERWCWNFADKKLAKQKEG